MEQEGEVTLREVLLDRDTLLLTAHALINSPNFTQEKNAKANALMNLAEKIGDGKRALPQDGAESRALADFLRTGKIEDRALGVGTPTQTTATGVLVPQAFYDKLTTALRAFDALFDEDVVTVAETETGAPLVMPALDDTANAATIIAESAQDPAEADPITSATIQVPSTYRTGLIVVSRELVEDSSFDISAILAQAFAIRIARGVGPNLVSTLLASAKLGVTAAGSAANTGGSETGATSIGWADLVGLVKSVDPAYRNAEKVAWLMNSDTLLALDSVITKNGQPMIHPQYLPDGRRMLLGYPVAICPSMPDIGVVGSPATPACPVAFGATSYWITRVVKGSTRVQRLEELLAEYGQIAYRGYTRANGQLLAVTSSQSPIKLLQNASL